MNGITRAGIVTEGPALGAGLMVGDTVIVCSGGTPVAVVGLTGSHSPIQSTVSREIRNTMSNHPTQRISKSNMSA